MVIDRIAQSAICRPLSERVKSTRSSVAADDAPSVLGDLGRGDADAAASVVNAHLVRCRLEDRALPSQQEPRAGLLSKSKSPASLNPPQRANSSPEQLIARAQMRQSNITSCPSQPSGSDDRLPEKHAKNRNHNDPKDKAPGILTTGHVVVGGQPVGIAHAKLLGRPPASQPDQTLIKIS